MTQRWILAVAAAVLVTFAAMVSPAVPTRWELALRLQPLEIELSATTERATFAFRL